MSAALSLSALLAIALSGLVSQGALAEPPEYDARLSQYDYPFSVHQFGFDSQRQSLEMAYMHLPAKDGQATVVLLHGKNFGSDYWEKTASHLHGKGYGVVMPDQVGFGKSSKPEHYQFTFEGLAKNTHRLLEHLELDRVSVMGHSMGGMLATRYALQYPEQVDRLVMVNPIGLEDYLRYVHYQDVDVFYQSELNKTIEGVRDYQREHYYDGEWSEQYEALIQIHAGWLRGPDWEQVAWNNALTFDMVFTGPVVNELQHLNSPTHLIIGTRDTTGPGRNWKRDGVEHELGRYDRLGKQTLERIDNARLHELDDMGHMPQFEAFDRYRAILDEIF